MQHVCTYAILSQIQTLMKQFQFVTWATFISYLESLQLPSVAQSHVAKPLFFLLCGDGEIFAVSYWSGHARLTIGIVYIYAIGKLLRLTIAYCSRITFRASYFIYFYNTYVDEKLYVRLVATYTHTYLIFFCVKSLTRNQTIQVIQLAILCT